jgi:hypothetical protein
MTRHLPLIGLGLLALAGCDDSGASAKPKAKDRSIIRKYTQDVFEVEAELKKGAQLIDPKIPATDYLSQQSKGYIFATTQMAIDTVKMRMEQYNALNGEYPKTYEEFMSGIIKSTQDPLNLPKLPFYMEYGYDVPNHQLVILRYPQREKDYQEEQDKKLGRR